MMAAFEFLCGRDCGKGERDGESVCECVSETASGTMGLVDHGLDLRWMDEQCSWACQRDLALHVCSYSSGIPIPQFQARLSFLVQSFEFRSTIIIRLKYELRQFEAE